MKMIKIALLGTAALAAVSVSARASEASDIAALKAQVEALTAQVAANEAQATVPAGYDLVAFTNGTAPVIPSFGVDKNYGTDAHLINVMPTADAPAAATTTIAWSGYVKAAAVYNVVQTPYANTALTILNTQTTTNSYIDIMAKTGMRVIGTTQTAVGEVGVNLGFQANWSTAGTYLNNAQAAVTTDGAWGYWKMTPEIALGGGYAGSLSGNSFGFDAQCQCNFTGTEGGMGNTDVTQMRLSYSSGPISAAVAVEDGPNVTTFPSASALGVAGQIRYAGDMFSAGLEGGWRGTSVSGGTAQDTWTISGGARVGLGDMGALGVGVGMGSGAGTTDDWTKASAIVSLNLGAQAHVEAGVAHQWNTNVLAGSLSVGNDFTYFGGGIYYDPVKQLTIGLEAAMKTYGSNSFASQANTGTAALVTIFRF